MTRQRCAVGQIKRELAKFKFLDFYKMLKNLPEGQKKIPRVTKIYVLWQLDIFSVAAVWKVLCTQSVVVVC
jgi:hypothetical protein